MKWLLDSEADAPPDSMSVLIAGGLVSRHHRGLEPGPMLRLLRRGAALSQGEVAERAGMTQARVSEIEKGKIDPRWGEIKRLLAATGCEPVLLAAGKGYQARPPAGEDEV